MSRRLPLLIVGIVGAVVVVIGVFLTIRLGRGTPVQVPVAIGDVPPGTSLEPGQFRLQAVRGLDTSTLEAMVEADEFGAVVGHETLETVHAGSPLLWAQVGPQYQSRLTLVVSGTDHLVYPLPVSADQVGNYLVAGDHVDVIFSLGRIAYQELYHVEEWAYDGPASPRCRSRRTTTQTTALCPGDTIAYTTTLNLPVSKVVLPDVRVLRVEREQLRTASASYGMGTGDEEARPPQTREGEIIRIYLELDRDQAEILSFALNNGTLNLPARAVAAGGESEGFLWEDFEELFYRGRPQEDLRPSDTGIED